MPDLYNMSDVFLSYSRRDEAFVRRLFESLKADGREVWADFEDIPKATDWWEEISAGIDAAETFVFVISPDSVNSDVCRKEIDHAVNCRKRFIPILYREVLDPADQEKMHPQVSSHNWIFFRDDDDDYDKAYQTLIDSLDQDLVHNRTMTRLLVRAREWQEHRKSSSYLLTGEDLENAEAWMAASFEKNPKPTELHMTYINVSRDAEARRQRRLLALVSAGLVVAVVLAIFAGFQTRVANQQREIAEQQRQNAETAREQAEQLQRRAEQARAFAEAAEADAEFNARKTQSLALAASSSEALLANNDPDLALVLALRAIEEVANPLPQVTNALTDAAYSAGTRNVITPGQIVVASVDYLNDNQTVVVGMNDHRVCLYIAETGDEVHCLAGEGEETAHASPIEHVKVDASGTRLLTVSTDNLLRYWNVDQTSDDFGMLVDAFAIEDDVTATALAPDGAFVLFGLADGRIGKWDIGSDDEIIYLAEVHTDEVTSLAIHTDDIRALSGSRDGDVIYWNLNTNEQLTVFKEAHDAEVMAVAFSPSGRLGASGDRDNGLLLWNLSLSRQNFTLQGHDEAVTGIEFSPDGRTLFTSSWDNSVREWEVQSGRLIKSFFGHSGGVNTVAVSPDGVNIVSGSFDNTVRLWRVDSFIQTRQMPTNDTVVVSADFNGLHIVTAQENGDVLLFDVRSGELIRDFHLPEGVEAEAVDVAFAPDGEIFAAVYDNNMLVTHEFRSSEVEWLVELESDEEIEQVLFSPDGAEVLLLTGDNMLLYDAVTGDFVRRIPYTSEQPPRFLSAAYSPDGTHVMVGLNRFSNNLHLVNVETGAIVRRFDGHVDGILAIDFSEAGTHVVTGAFDNDVRLWDVATGESIGLFFGHSDRVVSVSFAPESDWVISASNDRTVRLWDVESGFEIYNYRGHTQRVSSVTFSPRGNMILTGSHDSTLILWRLPQRGQELLDWVNENRYVRDLNCKEEKLYINPEIVCES